MAHLESPDFILGPLVASLLLGLTTIILLYWFTTRKHGYWEEKQVPFTPTVPVFGSLLEGASKPSHDIELDRYMKYGAIYGHYEGNRPLLSVADPALLREILVKDFPSFSGRRNLATGDEITDKMVSELQGEDWKRVRTIITPTFTTGKIKKMLSIFKDCSETLMRNFRKYAEKGQPVEVKSIYGAFTMDVIASSAFSTKIDSHNDPNNRFVTAARQVFTRKFNWRLVLFMLSGFMKLFRIGVFSPSAMKFFIESTLQIMEERKRTGQTRNDFLQLLMDTAKEVQEEGKLDEKENEDIVANYGKDDSQELFKTPYSKTNKKLSVNELIAQCVIFFIAGYDTTGSTLSFASYLLALNEDIQEKLRKEVDEILRETEGELTYETIQRMKYLDNVISETLRLYPPGARLERVAEEDYKLGDTGITVPKGMIVTIPVYAMHRDPKFFPDPLKFDPDRFTPEERTKRDQYVYLPFGAGPRNCVGMRFALMEVKTCLAFVISNFRIKRCTETKVPLDFYTFQALLQPNEVIVKLEIRDDKVKAH